MSSAKTSADHREVLIAGGGTAGLTLQPRRDMYLLKRYALPALYWRGMLRGRA
jgi:hypothetical protein